MSRLTLHERSWLFIVLRVCIIIIPVINGVFILMYDFAHPIEDAIEGVTHSICTLEFKDHRPLYDWLVREIGFEKPPKQIEFAKLYLTNVVTGKRYIKKLVEDGIVDGWDDPRLVSIAALRRRGFTPESIRMFMELSGVSKGTEFIGLCNVRVLYP